MLQGAPIRTKHAAIDILSAALSVGQGECVPVFRKSKLVDFRLHVMRSILVRSHVQQPLAPIRQPERSERRRKDQKRSYFGVHDLVSRSVQIFLNVLKIGSRMNPDEKLPDETFAQRPIGLRTCSRRHSVDDHEARQSTGCIVLRVFDA